MTASVSQLLLVQPGASFLIKYLSCAAAVAGDFTVLCQWSPMDEENSFNLHVLGSTTLYMQMTNRSDFGVWYPIWTTPPQ